VVERLFDQSYRPRPSAGYLFKKASGTAPRALRSTTSERGPVAVTAWLDSPHFRPLELRELYVKVEVAAGWHIYTDPIPKGFTALRVKLDADDEFVSWPAELPQGTHFKVEGLPEDFFVVEGEFTIGVPFKLPGSKLHVDGRPLPDPGEPRPVAISIDVQYQACSKTECLPPTSQTLRMEVEEVPSIPPER
jgi:hypothetical protein